VLGGGCGIMLGESDGEHGIGEAGGVCGVDGAAVAEGAGATNGGIELITAAIVDDAGVGDALPCEGDGNSEVRMAVGEIDRAVERINDPDAGGVEARGTAFFGEDAVVGAVRADHLTDDGFGFEIRGEFDIMSEAGMMGERAGILGEGEGAAGGAGGITGQAENGVEVGQGSRHQRGASIAAGVCEAEGSDMRSGRASGMIW